MTETRTTTRDVERIETQVHDIWIEVLGAPATSYDVDFVDAGGDSLAAILFITRLRSVFDVELLLEEFFMEKVTVRIIADLVTSKMDPDSKPKYV